MEIVAVAEQTVPAGSDVLFTNVSVGGSPSVIWRQGSGILILRGISRSQTRARFRVVFQANIAVPETETVGPVELTAALNGEGVLSSRMVSTPTAVDAFNNVSTDLYIDVPVGCCTQLTIKNTGTIPVAVVNANLIAERVA